MSSFTGIGANRGGGIFPGGGLGTPEQHPPFAGETHGGPPFGGLALPRCGGALGRWTGREEVGGGAVGPGPPFPRLCTPSPFVPT